MSRGEKGERGEGKRVLPSLKTVFETTIDSKKDRGCEGTEKGDRPISEKQKKKGG